MTLLARTLVVVLVASLTIVVGCGQPPPPDADLRADDIELALSVDRRIENLSDRAEKARAEKDSDESLAVAEEAVAVAGQIAQEHPFSDSLPDCEQLATTVAARDMQGLQAAADRCKKKLDEQTPPPQDGSAEVHRDRKIAAAVLKLAAIVAAFYGNYELAVALWTMSGEVGGDKHAKAPPSWVEAAKTSVSQDPAYQQASVAPKEVREGDLQSELTGHAVVNITGEEVIVRDGRDGRELGRFSTSNIAEWKDPATAPFVARRVELDSQGVLTFEYRVPDRRIFIVTPRADPIKPILVE